MLNENLGDDDGGVGVPDRSGLVEQPPQYGDSGWTVKDNATGDVRGMWR